MRKVLLSGALSLLIAGAFAQERLADPRVTYASTITATELKEHLEVLASDDFEGRETGEKGQKMAAEYISETYKINGVNTTGKINGYFQTFGLTEVTWGDRFIQAGEYTYRFFDDFYGFLNQNRDADINTDEIVFLGYGIHDKEYSDYEGKNVANKVIVILDGEPMRNGISVITGTETRSEWSAGNADKIQVAVEHGVSAVLIIDSKFQLRMDNERWRGWIDHGSMELKESYQEKALLNPLFISRAMADDLLGSKLAAAEKQINKKGKPRSFVIEKKIRVKITKLTEDVFSENVAGFVEGSDLKDEIVVVSAHYDHIGIIDGEVYNGADDDGSGTVAVMEIAQAMQLAKEAGNGPRRSILFLHFAGEEKGLLGSEYYAEHPIFPMEQTVADLNIDMVGRIDDAHAKDSNYVYIIGSNFLSTQLHEINEYNAEHYTKLNLDYTYNSTDDPNRFYYRSDHYNFAKFGVPVIFFFNGTHADYHGAGDEVDKISFNLLEQRARLVFQDLWTLANMDERIVVDVQQED